jgi:hemerythrin
MAYTWNSTLETGHLLIDSQHKELIKTINELVDACHQGQAADQVSKTLNFLLDYTKRHFHDEEALQQQSNYPDYPNHHKLHEDFVQSVVSLAAELKQTGPTPQIINKIVSGVGNWLVQHIMQQDTQVAAHIKKTAK